MLAPPGGLAPPPRGNPGSATGYALLRLVFFGFFGGDGGRDRELFINADGF